MGWWRDGLHYKDCYLYGHRVGRRVEASRYLRGCALVLCSTNMSIRVQYYVCCNIIVAQCPTSNITGNVTFASGNQPSNAVIGSVANFTCSPFFVWYGEASGSTVRSGTCSIVNGTGTWILQKKCISMLT